MTDFPRTTRELYPSDTRWGEGHVKSPLWGEVIPAYQLELDQIVAHIKETIQFFEAKYPDFHWWETDFVEENPAVSLLMQAVNHRLAFQCIGDVSCLMQKVRQEDVVVPDADSPEGYAGRLAVRALATLPDGHAQLYEAQLHMTPQDRQIFWQVIHEGRSPSVE